MATIQGFHNEIYEELSKGQHRVLLALNNRLKVVSYWRVATLLDRELRTGHYAVTWDGTDAGGRSVASGVYMYRLDADGVTRTRKMMLVK